MRPRLEPRSRASAVLALGALLVVGCDEPTPAPDGATLEDAGEPEVVDARALPDAESSPFSLAIEDDATHARLEVSTDPLTIRLLGGDGRVLLESAEGGLELGTAVGGATRYHDVTVEAPVGVTWSRLGLGVERVSASEGIVGDASGLRARITLTRLDEGVLGMRVEALDDARRVALSRLRWVMTDESYQGLGERFYGADARGYVVPMQMSVTSLTRESGLNEHHVPVPFVVGSRSWGLFVETREAGAFDVGASDPSELRASFEGGALDCVFFARESPREVIAAYTRHTGLPILPPRWAFAPMHWRNEWRDRAALEEDERALVALHLPATSFWIDNPWLRSYVDNVFDESRFEDPRGMLAALRGSGFRPLVWNVPYLDAPDDGVADNEAERLHERAEREGLLVRRDGETFVAPSTLGVTGLRSPGGMVDFTEERAIAFWRERVDPLVSDLGVRAFKLDFGEDVLPEFGNMRLRLEFGDGTSERETHNVYAMRYHLPYRRALDERSSEGGFLLVRASTWGGQRVADIVWPGDIDASFARGDRRVVGGLPAAISAMLSLAASGFPSFAADTGGYRHGPPSLELLMRWVEQSAFSPFFQLGGGGEHHNPWLYAPTALVPDPTGTYRELARAHTELIPYLRLHAIAASERGTPPVLHPSLAFPDDRAGYADPDAYLLGDDLFVAPVVVEGASTRSLHLPPGRWVHLFSGEAFEGPRELSVEAPIGAPPVFVRVGALIPMYAHDLETLVPAPAPFEGGTRVDPAARPFLRVRSIPMGARERETEGFRVAVTVDDGLTLEVEPRASADPTIETIRFEIDLAHASPAIDEVHAVTVDGVALAEEPLAELEASAPGVRWAREGARLFVFVPRAGARVLVR